MGSHLNRTLKMEYQSRKDMKYDDSDSQEEEGPNTSN